MFGLKLLNAVNGYRSSIRFRLQKKLWLLVNEEVS